MENKHIERNKEILSKNHQNGSWYTALECIDITSDGNALGYIMLPPLRSDENAE